MDDFLFKGLTSGAELQAEGTAMEHCVGSKAPNCSAGYLSIFHMSRKGFSPSTLAIDIVVNAGRVSFELGEIKGPRKRPADDLAVMAAQHLVRDLTSGTTLDSEFVAWLLARRSPGQDQGTAFSFEGFVREKIGTFCEPSKSLAWKAWKSTVPASTSILLRATFSAIACLDISGRAFSVRA
ncbi:MAG: hypothetical protein ACT4QA_24170 [Panacagrimonas sp.]